MLGFTTHHSLHPSTRLRGERLTSFIEDVQVGVIDENPVAALAGQLAGDAGGDQSLHGFGGGGESHPMFVAQVFQGEHGPLSQRGEDAKGTKARTFSPPREVDVEVPRDVTDQSADLE